MAAQIDICNIALQLLGANRLNALDETTRSARSCAACYEILRDDLLTEYRWVFALKRAVLAPSVAKPLFEYNYQFPLPSDCLTPIIPPRTTIDWMFEGGNLLTNDGTTINLRYVARITDVSQFDISFVYALGASMAMHMCEEITQSNSKIQNAQAYFDRAIAKAKKNNAMEKVPAEAPEDTWLAARYAGTDGQAPWLRGQ